MLEDWAAGGVAFKYGAGMGKVGWAGNRRAALLRGIRWLAGALPLPSAAC